MVRQKSGSCLSPVSWVSWHLFPGGLDCMDLTKHEIRVIDNKSFKERFQRIPSPTVDEVHAHVKEMLEVDAIHCSQSPWCSTSTTLVLLLVLVSKKDIGLPFCIDFCKLNTRTKKDSYPLSQVQEAIESLVGAGCFSCLDLKAGFWQIAMDEASKQYTTFTMGNLGFFNANVCHLGCVMALPLFKG